MTLIKEKGGSGNAYTLEKETGYWTIISPDKAEWALDIFSKMFVNKHFDPELVNKEKSVVFQEIGRPEAIDILGYLGITALITRLNEENFRKTELGIVEPTTDRLVTRYETGSLRAKDLQLFFDQYYHAGNMNIFISGNFQTERMLKKLNSAFAGLKKSGSPGWIDVDPKPREKPYLRDDVAIFRPKIQRGFKVADLSYEEEQVGRIYFEDLAERL